MKRLFYIFLLLLLPSLCFADINFTPAQSDASVILLSNIFGIVGNILHGTGSQVLGQMFKVFNSAVLVIGGIILFYIFVVSTLNTAHQGEVLGRNWSSIWIPIRAVLGMLLLIPTNTGYCVAQIIVMWLVVQGVGAGNQVWNSALDYLSRGGVIAAHNINVEASAPAGERDAINDATEVAGNILKGTTCVIALQNGLENIRETLVNAGLPDPGAVPDLIGSLDFNKAERDAQATYDATPLPIAKPGEKPQEPPDEGSRSLSFPNQNVWNIPLTGMCGAATWDAVNMQKLLSNLYGQSERWGTTGVGFARQGERNEPTETSWVPGEQGAKKADIWSMKNFNDWRWNNAQGQGNISLSKEAYADARNSRATALQGMFESINGTASSIVNNFLSSDPQPLGQILNDEGTEWGVPSGNQTPLLTGYELKNAALTYLGIMKPTINAMNGAIKGLDFIKSAKADGWIMAGSYFFNVADANANINKITTEKGKINFTLGPGVKVLQDGLDTRLGSNKAIINSPPPPPASISGTPGPAPGPKPLDTIAAYATIPLTPYSPAPLNPKTSFCNAQNTITNQIACYVESAQKRAMRGDVGTKGPKYVFTFNFMTLSPMQDMECAGWFCLVSAMYNILVVRSANALFIPAINWMLVGFQTVVIVPLAESMSQFISTITFAMFKDGGNPIIVLAQAGNSLVNTVGTTWVAGVGVAAAGGSSPFINTMVAALITIMPLLVPILAAMLTAGLMMAYYIPLTPYLLYTFAGFGWLIAVVESMVAAPLVALGLAHPEGHEAFGKAEPAISLLLNVFLRPAMTVIGFIAGIILSYVGVWLLNEGFIRATQGVLGTVTGLTSLLGPLAILMIYVLAVSTIVQTSFALIHNLPDKVLRWLSGGAQARFGEEAGRMAQEVKGGAEKQAGAAGQATGSDIGKRVKAAHKAAQAEGGEEETKAGDGLESGSVSPEGGEGESGSVSTEGGGGGHGGGEGRGHGGGEG